MRANKKFKGFIALLMALLILMSGMAGTAVATSDALDEQPALTFSSIYFADLNYGVDWENNWSNPPSQVLTITNIGNTTLTGLDTTLVYCPYSDSYWIDFDAFEITTPLSATTLAPGQSATISIRPVPYLPPIAMLFFGSELVFTSDCGLAQSIGLGVTIIHRRDRSEAQPALTLSPIHLDFDYLRNNSDEWRDPAYHVFTLINTSNTTITGLNATLTSGSWFDYNSKSFEVVRPLSGTALAPGQSATIAIRPMPYLPISNSGPDYWGDLEITSGCGLVVNAHMTAYVMGRRDR